MLLFCSLDSFLGESLQRLHGKDRKEFNDRLNRTEQDVTTAHEEVAQRI